MAKTQIRHRYTGSVLFETKLPADCAGKSDSVRLGAAVQIAIEATASLSRADLSRAELSGADLSDANLSRADLSGADLSDADLTRANLSDAYLTYANLSDASLSDASLSRANLSYANLTGADLTRANLSDAYLSGAKGVIDAGTPDGWRCVGWLRDGWLSIRVGCRNKRLAEGREYWAGRQDRREVLAALDHVEAVAILRGWAVEAPSESNAA